MGRSMLDLHLHSSHSDGTMTPAQLVDMARERGLVLVSITDHDTVSGTGEALAAGRRHGVRVFSGLELSVSWRAYQLHLLAYDFDWHNAALLSGLSVLQKARDQRNRKIVDTLAGLGLPVDEDELRVFAGGGQTGRPHIARLLVAKRVVGSIDQAFARYLRKGACAYVPRYVFPVDQACALIHGAGGLAVLAHPGQLAIPLDELAGLLDQLKEHGLDGLETFYPTQKGKQLRQLRALADRFQLLETGGSDYHGDIRPRTCMAGGPHFTVPGEILAGLQHRWNTNQQQSTGTNDQ